jgi:precorrin-3B C17-methyltransferase
LKKIYVVGFGPGEKRYMTGQAVEAIETADLVVGYTTYINLLKPQFPKQQFYATPMRKEVDRCRAAVEEAASGKTVALVSSGDSGVYGMAGILLEILEQEHPEIQVEIVPGVTAACAAAAALGAPLMHDFAMISLSDCMTPLELIYKRVRSAADGDFVLCLYNPKPVGIVRSVGRPEEKVWITTLAQLKDQPVDMLCVVLIGNSQTYVKNGKMITPRGYSLADGAQDS